MASSFRRMGERDSSATPQNDKMEDVSKKRGDSSTASQNDRITWPQNDRMPG